MNSGTRFAVLRLIPVFVLVAVAFGLQYGVGLDRLPSAGLGLIAAIAARLALMRVWK
ncbi:hypothetical protein [Algimonas arctica]|nr:hypothetical protein [Algimonas arctica]